MVPRRVTQPMENENGSSSGVDRTWVLMSTIFMARQAPGQTGDLMFLSRSVSFMFSE